MLRALAILVVVHAAAMADSVIRVELPALGIVLDPPATLPTRLSAADRAARTRLFEAALPRTRAPRARANLTLGLADLALAEHLAKRREGDARADASDYEASIRLAGEADAAWFRAYALYHALPDDPQWKSHAQARAHYAYLLDAMSKDHTQAVHRQLVAAHPDSPHAARSHLVVGDHALSLGDLERARTHYEAVRSDEPAVQAYALYRSAAIDLARDRDAARAYGKLAQALALEPPPALRAVTLHGLVVAYAGFGDPARAFDTFVQAGGDGRASALELARTYLVHHATERAAIVFAGLVRRFPWDPEACRWQTEVTQVAHVAPDAATRYRASEALVAAYRRLQLAMSDDERSICEASVRAFTLRAASEASEPALARQLEHLARTAGF